MNFREILEIYTCALVAGASRTVALILFVIVSTLRVIVRV